MSISREEDVEQRIMLTTVVVVGATHPPPRPRECINILFDSGSHLPKVVRRSETDNQALKGGMGIVIEVLTIAQNSYVQTTTVVHIIYRK